MPKQNFKVLADPAAATEDSREKLLRAAEHLFGGAGYEAVSIRELAAEAGVNTALIAYYFGSKEGLFTAAYQALAEPINRERIAALDRLAGANSSTLEDVLEAWIRPVFRHDAGQARHMFIRVSAFLSDQKLPLFERLVSSTHGAVNLRFLEALETCLPNVSRPTLLWRLYYLIGMLSVATGTIPAGMKKLAAGAPLSNDSERGFRHMLAFALAGFRAPEPQASAGDDRPER